MKFLKKFFSSNGTAESAQETFIIPNIRLGMWCVDVDTKEVCIPTSVNDHGIISVDYAHVEDGTYLRTAARPITKLRQATHEEIPEARRPAEPARHLGY